MRGLWSIGSQDAELAARRDEVLVLVARSRELVEREPLQIRWEGYEIYTMPAPSAGGLVLAETLGMFSRAELVRLGYQSPAYQHILAEAFRSALIDRFRYFGDPARVPVDMSRLLDPARLAQRRKALSFAPPAREGPFF